jgi:hypothetical protein
MIDDWEHTAPFGALGWLADRLVLGRHVRHLLEWRNATTNEDAERVWSVALVELLP